MTPQTPIYNLRGNRPFAMTRSSSASPPAAMSSSKMSSCRCGDHSGVCVLFRPCMCIAYGLDFTCSAGCRVQRNSERSFQFLFILSTVVGGGREGRVSQRRVRLGESLTACGRDDVRKREERVACGDCVGSCSRVRMYVGIRFWGVWCFFFFLQGGSEGRSFAC
jgi:hypothetical protein